MKPWAFFKVNMSNIKKRKMVAMKVLETSGVDHPAHLEEGWIVMKSAKSTEATVSEEIGMEQSLEDAYIERVVELEKALTDSQAQIEAMEKAHAKAKDEDEDEDKDKDKDEDDDYEDDMMKSLPKEVRELLEKAQGEATLVREELRKERESRRDEEFVAKAATWSHLTVDPEEVGPALRRLTDLDAKLGEQIEKALVAANAQAESAAIFEEIGRGSRPDDGNAYATVQAMAKAAVTSGEFKTMEQAVTGVIGKNPELYAAYRAENH